MVICCTNHSQSPFSALATNIIANEAVGGRAGTCFPFYMYDEDGSNRRENITDWAHKQFKARYKDKKLTKWDIFHYVYGLLHHPGYRTKFADNLKKSLPRIPFAPDFRAFADAGKELAALHVDYEKLEPHPLTFVEAAGVRTGLPRHRQDEAVNKEDGATRERLAYACGYSEASIPEVPASATARQLGWVIDQYQVIEDKRSGIKSDPNRPDDPEYIVRLVGQVVKVSLETVRIVAALPTAFSESTAGIAPAAPE